MRSLLDDEGENLAVRSFLMQYSCDRAISIGQMRYHMDMAGWGRLWPDWVKEAHANTHLTKAGAQLWLRYLFTLETA